MRLNTIFITLYFQFGNVFAPPPTNLELSLSSDQLSRGFLCGNANAFYSDSQVLKVQAIAQQYLGRGTLFPEKYTDYKLHSEARFKDYFQYPIRSDRGVFQPNSKVTSYYYKVVFNRIESELEVVDVIAKIAIDDYAKCFRTNTALVTPSLLAPETLNTYQCGYKYIENEVVEETRDRAMKKKNQHFPAPSFGNIYPAYSGYLIWPFYRADDTIYYSGNTNIGRYFMVLDEKNNFVDVVVKGFGQQLFIYIKSKKFPQAPASNSLSNPFVPPPRFIYRCGKFAFAEKVILNTLATIKDLAIKRKIGSKLEHHDGAPFSQQGWIGTVSRSGKLSAKGRPGPFRIILTQNFHLIGIAVVIRKQLKACRKVEIAGRKNHDTSSYQCYREIFSHQQLVAAAEQACKKMNKIAFNKYPATYEGPKFVYDGDYLTFPISSTDLFGDVYRLVGPHRVAINWGCEVVGAFTTPLITIDSVYSPGDSNSKKLIKCHRLEDGPMPHNFGRNAMIGTEYFTIDS